jgi:cytochrome c5
MITQCVDNMQKYAERLAVIVNLPKFPAHFPLRCKMTPAPEARTCCLLRCPIGNGGVRRLRAHIPMQAPLPGVVMKVWFVLSAIALGSLACGGDEEAAPSDVDCDGTVPTFAQVTAFQRVCTNCHDSSLDGAERNGAPEGYDFDVYERAEDEAEEIAEHVEDGSMPPSSSGLTLTANEESALMRWALCGTPE